MYERWVESDPTHSPVQKRAWQFLLTHQYTLKQICDELDILGYTRASGDFTLENMASSLYLSSVFDKIQIGPLERLPKPIRAHKWRRITFIYTTGAYLIEAETINDLVVQSDERQLSWRALRERAQSQDYVVSDLPDIDVNPVVLASLLGITKNT